MPDHRLYDSSALTPPPEPREEAVTSNVEMTTAESQRLLDSMFTDDTVFVTRGLDVARGYDPTIERPRPGGAWSPPPLRSILPNLRVRDEYIHRESAILEHALRPHQKESE
jgi:hypothetical protein